MKATNILKLLYINKHSHPLDIRYTNVSDVARNMIRTAAINGFTADSVMNMIEKYPTLKLRDRKISEHDVNRIFKSVEREDIVNNVMPMDDLQYVLNYFDPRFATKRKVLELKRIKESLGKPCLHFNPIDKYKHIPYQKSKNSTIYIKHTRSRGRPKKTSKKLKK